MQPFFSRHLERKGIIHYGRSAAQGDAIGPCHKIAHRPVIFFALATLISLKIREIAIVAPGTLHDDLRVLLGDGFRFGVRLEYLCDTQAPGLAGSCLVARDFLSGSPCALLAGNSILSVADLYGRAGALAHLQRGATVFSVPWSGGALEPGAQTALGAQDTGPRQAGHEKFAGLFLLDARAPSLASWLAEDANGARQIIDLLGLYESACDLHLVDLSASANVFTVDGSAAAEAAEEFVTTQDRRCNGFFGAPELEALRQGFAARRSVRAWADAHAAEPYGAALARALRPVSPMPSEASERRAAGL
ncbi:MAG: sugar phosphate nucleotidyltransferase [Pseudomonadota bacterium]